MTAFTFQELPLDDRCNLLWSKGAFLYNCMDEARQHLYNLYELADMLVELKYFLPTKEIVCVQVVAPNDMSTLLRYVQSSALPKQLP